MNTFSHVTPASPMARVLGERYATAHCTLSDLMAMFGDPTYTGSPDDKVSMSWVFKTPRGNAEVRDYWWNAENEQSIAASNRMSARWMARFLVKHGVRVSQ